MRKELQGFSESLLRVFIGIEKKTRMVMTPKRSPFKIETSPKKNSKIIREKPNDDFITIKGTFCLNLLLTYSILVPAIFIPIVRKIQGIFPKYLSIVAENTV